MKKMENDGRGSSSNLEILPEIAGDDEFIPCKMFLGAKQGVFHHRNGVIWLETRQD